MPDKAPGGHDTSTAQLVLDFPKSDPNALPFVETPATESALLMLTRWRFWPDGQMAMIGENASGRTRLLRRWAEETGAAYIEGPDLAKADITQVSNLSISALAVDDADLCENGAPLLAAMNLCRDRNATILISGKSDPSTWNMRPLDLQSRLTAFPVVRIEPLDQDTFEKRLIAACRIRFMKLPDETARYLAERMVRSYQAIEKMARCLEEAADGKALTKTTARKAIEKFGDTGDEN